MRNIPELYNPNLIFWEVFPQFLLVDPFTKFHKNDKSRKKTFSSNIMWAISLLLHPDSEIYNVSDKYEQINKTMMGDKDFDWSKYQEHMDEFVNIALSQGKKSLVAMNDRLRNRDAFLKEQTYSFDYYNDQGKLVKGTADQLDAMEARTAKLYEQYFKIQKELEAEKSSASKRGSKMESLSDSNQI